MRRLTRKLLGRGQPPPARLPLQGERADFPLPEEIADLFDSDFYAQRYGVEESEAWAHYVREGESRGHDPSPYFSTDFYWQHASSGSRRQPGLLHFLEAVESGQSPPVHPLFDAVFYRSLYPEIGDSPAWVHFVRHGDADGRRPSEAFDPEFYRRTYMPLEERRPLRHYALIGARSGFLAAPSPRSAAATQKHLAEQLPTNPVIITANDAQRGGGPMVALRIGEAMAEQGRSPVFLLRTAGPLLERFRAIGPTFIEAEGWEADGFWAAVGEGTGVIANTVVCSDLALSAHRAGLPVLLLAHEYPRTVEDLGFADAFARVVQAGVRVGFSLDGVREQFETAYPPVRSGQFTTVGIAPYEAQPRPEDYAEALAHLGGGRIVAGAGNADERKGFDLFLKTAELISQRDPSIRILWFGHLTHWAQELLRTAREKGQAVEHLEFVTPFQAWIAACDVLLVTSRSDVGPGTVLYAALEGVGLVGLDTEIGTAAHIRALGDLVPAEDLEAAAEACMRQIRESSPGIRAHRRATASEYSIGAYLTRIVKALHG